MKVHELIAKLSSLDQNLDVYCYIDIDFSAKKDPEPAAFDVLGVSSAQVVTSRDENRKPQLTFGGAPGSRPLAIIDITPDF